MRVHVNPSLPAYVQIAVSDSEIVLSIHPSFDKVFVIFVLFLFFLYCFVVLLFNILRLLLLYPTTVYNYILPIHQQYTYLL